ncbi:hypothetical protein H6F42_15920 [Pseudanabaena sp. FACHB-1998]|uniref:hypothetical protein n=1 Tax=Pseudanabaena sp. FACHB-1998 TaxID=2692858 RepID=UPI0016815DFD|nr:hypothetical protein [Pseudanabaena sp. FACHB-1998]MBD2178407.1 hypothetical protein [Pseudanabaena sp. FACHB-1998]
MTAKRDPYFVKVGTNAWGQVQVDRDIYDGDIAPALGFTKTQPPDNAEVRKFRNQRDILQTARVVRVFAQVTRDVSEGGETVTKSRRVPLLCDLENVGRVAVSLRGKTVKLGDQNLTWEVQNVTFGS